MELISFYHFRLTMDQLAGLPQLPLSSNDIGSQASCENIYRKYLDQKNTKVDISSSTFFLEKLKGTIQLLIVSGQEVVGARI